MKVNDSITRIASRIINNKIKTILEPLTLEDINSIQDLVEESGIKVQIEPLDEENNTYVVNYF